MDTPTFSRPVPIEHIRNVGIFDNGGGRYPESVKVTCKRSDKTYQINLLSHLSTEDEYLDFIADGIILQTIVPESSLSTINSLTLRYRNLSQPVPCMISCDYKHGYSFSCKTWLQEFMNTESSTHQ